METEDNVVEMDEWQGGDETPMTEEQYHTAMEELLTLMDPDRLGVVIGGSLEILTMNAVEKGSFYLETDDKSALTVIAVGDEADNLRKILPDTIVNWDTLVNDFESNRDPGDEQDEPATESE